MTATYPSDDDVVVVDDTARPVSLALRGAVTSYHADAVHQACLQAAAAVAPVTVDLGEVRYLGAAAIQILIALRRTLAQRGQPLRVAPPPAALAELLTGLGVLDLVLGDGAP